MLTLQNFINGQFQEPSEKKYLERCSPQSSEVIYQYPLSNAMDAVMAIQSARKNQNEWAELEPEIRIQYLQKILEYFVRHSIEIINDESNSQGIDSVFLKSESFQSGVEYWSQYCQLSDEDQKKILQASGVIAIIIPWTLSFKYLLQKVAPALYYGNSVVVKSSRNSALSADWLAKAAVEVGIPQGVINVVHGRGQDVGSILCAHPAVAGVAFSGSLKSAEKIIESASKKFKKLQLFMGVKNSAIVLSDFDFLNMPRIVDSCFTAGGQLPQSISRIFVSEPIYDQFCEKFRAEILKKSIGSFLISAERADQAHSYLNLAMQEGAKLLVGAKDFPTQQGAYFAPTVLLNLSNCSELQQLDLQSPIVILTSVKYQHEAIKWVNTGYAGHLTQVWSNSAEKAVKAAHKLDQSLILHNQWVDGVLSTERIKGTRLSFYGLFDDEDFNAEVKSVSVKNPES